MYDVVVSDVVPDVVVADVVVVPDVVVPGVFVSDVVVADVVRWLWPNDFCVVFAIVVDILLLQLSCFC